VDEKGGKSFLDRYKKSYVFLGCLDNYKTAYLIGFPENKKYFLNCDTTQTGWHIRINHRLYWYFPKEPDINLSKFEQSLSYSEIRKKQITKEKKAYERGMNKRKSECIKDVKKMKEKYEELSKEINKLIEKLQKGQKI